jgi:hypothetical protein
MKTSPPPQKRFNCTTYYLLHSINMKGNIAAPVELTQSSASASPSNQEEVQPPSAVVMMEDPSLPLPTRKRTNIEGCQPPDDEDDNTKQLPTTTRRPITTTTTSSHKRQRKKELPTTVRFASVLHQTRIVPRWTKDDVTRSWYSKHDISAFKHQESIDATILRTLIHVAPTIDTLPQEAALYRGLERLLCDQITSEISERRQRCVSNVLVAQYKGLDMDLIAQVSKNITEKAAAWAFSMGSI